MASACALLFAALVWFAWARKETHRAAAEESLIRSVAVLPLTDLAADSSEDYFADGMTEELITELGRLSSIRIISRTSIMQFKKSVRSLPEIGRQLNVDALVEGTVRRSGDRVRITARLVGSRRSALSGKSHTRVICATCWSCRATLPMTLPAISRRSLPGSKRQVRFPTNVWIRRLMKTTFEADISSPGGPRKQ